MNGSDTSDISRPIKRLPCAECGEATLHHTDTGECIICNSETEDNPE